jgi:hypothetical protein
MVIEKTVPATPIVEDATAPRSVRAPVAPALYSQLPSTTDRGMTLLRSIARRMNTNAIPAPTSTAGVNQNVSPIRLTQWRKNERITGSVAEPCASQR